MRKATGRNGLGYDILRRGKAETAICCSVDKGY